jgi:hypothetical protein
VCVLLFEGFPAQPAKQPIELSIHAPGPGRGANQLQVTQMPFVCARILLSTLHTLQK